MACGLVGLVAVSVAGVALVGAARPSRLDAEQQAVVDGLRIDGGLDAADAVALVDAEIEILLSDEVAGAVESGLVASTLEAALAVPDGRDERLDRVAAAVSAEGAIHDDELRAVLAAAVASNVAWVDDRINEPFRIAGQPDPVAVDRGLALHDLIRELVRGEGEADVLLGAFNEFGSAGVAAAPDGGDGRQLRLYQLGRVHNLLNMAQRNAAEGAAAAAGDADALERALEATNARAWEARQDLATWAALDRFETDPELRASAAGQPFVTADGSLRADFTAEERAAFRAWAVSLTGPDDGGLIRQDWEQMVTGGADLELPPVMLAGRF